jgi:hypothetical protein
MVMRCNSENEQDFRVEVQVRRIGGFLTYFEEMFSMAPGPPTSEKLAPPSEIMPKSVIWVSEL